MSDPVFDGAVLCGGASRRMGRDKALIVVDGLPMYRRVVDALGEAGAGTLTVVGGDRRRLHGDHAFVADRWPGEGPLGGVITALDSPGSAPVVAVLSCDLLAPDPIAIAELVAVGHRADCDVVVPVADGREQWTHAVWNRRASAVLAGRFDAGARAIRAAVEGLSVVAHTIVPEAVADADQPDDLPGPGTGTA